THTSRDVRGPAAEYLHAPHFEELARRGFDSAQMRRIEARLQAAAQRAANRIGLLGDLLAHVVRERALVERFARPVDRQRSFRRRPAFERRGLEALSAHYRDLAIIEMHDA